MADINSALSILSGAPQGNDAATPAPQDDISRKLSILTSKPSETPQPEQKPIDTSFGARAKRFAVGTYMGVMDPIDAGAQLLTRGLESLAPEGSSFQKFMTGERQKVEDINATRADTYERDYHKNLPGIDWGRVTGNTAATLPLAAAAPATLAGGAIIGGATGALQPVDTRKTDSFWGEKAKQTALGSVLGVGGTAVAKGVGRIISPQTAPEVKTLMDAGVTPTPGQVLGGGFKRIEEGATSVPVLGDIIKSGQARATQDFNRAAINRALEPIGEKLDPKMMLGNQAIEEAGQKLSNAYNTLLPKLTVRADQRFVGDISNLTNLAGNLPKDRAAQFKTILTDKVLSKFNPQTGMMTGESMKEAESALGLLIRGYGKSPDGDQQLLAGVLRQAQQTLRDVTQRSNPAYADELANINKGFANFIRVENAAGRLGSKEGVFSPAGLRGAVRATDSSLRKGAFARGNALMQDLADAGEKVLGPKVPDSGSPFRIAVGASIPAAAAISHNPMTGVAASLPMLAYTPLGQRAMAATLASRPAIAQPIGAAVNRASPFVGAAATPLLQQLMQ